MQLISESYALLKEGSGSRQRPARRRPMPSGRRANWSRIWWRSPPPSSGAGTTRPGFAGGPHPGRGRSEGHGDVDLPARHGPARAGAEHRYRREHAQSVGAAGPADRRAGDRGRALRVSRPPRAGPRRPLRLTVQAVREALYAGDILTLHPGLRPVAAGVCRPGLRPGPARRRVHLARAAASSARCCCGRSGPRSSASRTCPICSSTPT